MKFGKSLNNQIEETLPEWRDKFLAYKDLKKKLKLIEPEPHKGTNTSSEYGSGGEVEEGLIIRASKRPRFDDGSEKKDYMTDAEVEFVKLLEDEIEKFNSFFVEKEEEYIICLKELQDRVAKSKDRNDEIMKIRKEIVDLHGEMVLLENYSALNYTGLVKILKKYDKRTGALLRLPFIQKVLQQPFFTTDLIYKLVKECETLNDRLFLVSNAPSTTEEQTDENEPSTSGNRTNEGLLRGKKELTEIEYMESLYMKSTISALRSMKEIRSKSSTVSVFSLPPLQISGLEDTWNKIPILEQLAK